EARTRYPSAPLRSSTSTCLRNISRHNETSDRLPMRSPMPARKRAANDPLSAVFTVPPESAAANVMVSLPGAAVGERQRFAQRRLAVVRVDGVVERRAGECVLKATLNLFENRTTI